MTNQPARQHAMHSVTSVRHRIRPARITCYDDVPGPTAGERIELSGRVIGTWVSKAANALQEEWDLEPGSTVRLAMRPHWRPPL